MNIQNIKNETLAKLTSKEIGALDLLNHGVMTYRGQLKSRVKGFKMVKVSEIETHFTLGGTFEFVEIQSDDDEKHFAMRCRDEDGKYLEFVAPLAGLPFLK